MCFFEPLSVTMLWLAYKYIYYFHCFIVIGNYWYESDKFTASYATTNNQFCESADISGNFLVVGMPYYGSLSSGAAWMFERNVTSNKWIEIGILIPDDTEDKA